MASGVGVTLEGAGAPLRIDAIVQVVEAGYLLAAGQNFDAEFGVFGRSAVGSVNSSDRRLTSTYEFGALGGVRILMLSRAARVQPVLRGGLRFGMSEVREGGGRSRVVIGPHLGAGLMLLLGARVRAEAQAMAYASIAPMSLVLAGLLSLSVSL